MYRKLKYQLLRGKTHQPIFENRKILFSFLGSFIAISILSIICIYENQSLLIAPFGASTVLLFGISESPLAQPRNLILGNLFGSITAIFSLNCFGNNSFSCAIAVASAITLGQIFRCLHPPSGAVALLGVISNSEFNYILSPVLVGSIVLVLWGIIFNRIFKVFPKYPIHWL